MAYYLYAPSDSTVPVDCCHQCCCTQVSIGKMKQQSFVISYADWGRFLAPRGLSDTKIHVEVSHDSDYEKVPVIIDSEEYQEGAYVNKDVNGTFYEYLREYRTDAKIEDNKIYSNPSPGEYFYSVLYDSDGKVESYLAKTFSKKSPKKELIRYEPSVLDRLNFLLKLDIHLTPFADVGDVIRLNIKQFALDCDCKEYVNKFCIDLNVVKC